MIRIMRDVRTVIIACQENDGFRNNGIKQAAYARPLNAVGKVFFFFASSKVCGCCQRKLRGESGQEGKRGCFWCIWDYWLTFACPCIGKTRRGHEAILYYSLLLRTI